MNEAENKRDEELMECAKTIVRKKHELFISAICYIAVNLMLIFIWFMTGAGFFWPVFCIIGWGLGLVVAAFDIVLLINSAGYSDKVDREYQKLKRHSDK